MGRAYKGSHNYSLHDENPQHTIRISSRLDEGAKQWPVDFLHNNDDIFAWHWARNNGTLPECGPYSLTNEAKKEKLRSRMAKGHCPVDKLINTRLNNSPNWLTNVVLVKKANGKWRMYIDFTDLNKANPKDSYLLPRIDQLVDATTGRVLYRIRRCLAYRFLRLH